MNQDTAGVPTRPKLLVAEDNLLIAEFTRQLLIDLGYDVLGPFSALDEVLDCIEAHSMDGALLDLDLDGASVLPAARALAGRDIPFIVATGHRGLADLPAPLAQAPFLAKPFDDVMLERLVRATFRLPATVEAPA